MSKYTNAEKRAILTDARDAINSVLGVFYSTPARRPLTTPVPPIVTPVVTPTPAPVVTPASSPAPAADDPTTPPAWFTPGIQGAIQPIVARLDEHQTVLVNYGERLDAQDTVVGNHEERITALEENTSVDANGLNWRAGGAVAAVLTVLLFLIQVITGTTAGVAAIFALVASAFVGFIVAMFFGHRPDRTDNPDQS